MQPALRKSMQSWLAQHYAPGQSIRRSGREAVLADADAKVKLSAKARETARAMAWAKVEPKLV